MKAVGLDHSKYAMDLCPKEQAMIGPQNVGVAHGDSRMFPDIVTPNLSGSAHRDVNALYESWSIDAPEQVPVERLSGIVAA
jgi:hypothetical protein